MRETTLDLLFFALIAVEDENRMNRYDLMFVAMVFLATVGSAIITLLVLS